MIDGKLPGAILQGLWNGMGVLAMNKSEGDWHEWMITLDVPPGPDREWRLAPANGRYQAPRDAPELESEIARLTPFHGSSPYIDL